MKYPGIIFLLKRYGPYYKTNATWWLSIITGFISIFLVSLDTKTDYLRNILDIGITIFPAILSLSLASTTFVLASLDKDTFEPFIKNKDKNGVSLYERAFLSFMFFVFTTAVSLFIFLLVKIVFVSFTLIPHIIQILCSILLIYLIIFLMFSVLDIISAVCSVYKAKISILSKEK